MRITALAGGTGAAKLLRGLSACVDAAALTVIGNTGDDAEIWGLHVSPDLDSVMYALTGMLDTRRGWGRADETFHCLAAMASFGAPTWFGLGDRDLATHVARTQGLAEGRSLSAITESLSRGLGLRTRLLPMSDDRVRTIIQTPEGPLAFQEYFVRHKAMVEVVGVEYAGAAAARPAPGVREAIVEADVVVVCPSNPITSIGPMLAVPGIVEALASTRASVIGISPLVDGGAVSGPAAALMRACALPISTVGVARAYAPWLRRLLIDPRDAHDTAELARLGVTAITTDIMMPDHDREIALAQRLLDLS